MHLHLRPFSFAHLPFGKYALDTTIFIFIAERFDLFIDIVFPTRMRVEETESNSIQGYSLYAVCCPTAFSISV